MGQVGSAWGWSGWVRLAWVVLLGVGDMLNLAGRQDTHSEYVGQAELDQVGLGQVGLAQTASGRLSG